MQNQNGTRPNRAAAFKQKQAKEVILPSGAAVLLRTAPLQAWWTTEDENGKPRIPQAFTKVAIRAQAAANPEQFGAQVLEEETPEERVELMRFMAKCIKHAFVSPRIVDEVQDGDEDVITLEDLGVDDFNFAFRYATGQAPAQTIPTTQGEVTVAAVETFHPSGQHESSTVTGDGVSEVRTPAFGDAGLNG